MPPTGTAVCPWTGMQAPNRLDCLVIGAGPAGLTAAIYLRRYLRHVLVVDAGRSRAMAIGKSNNFPGFPEGISGNDLLARLREQLAGVLGALLTAEVTAVYRDADHGLSAQCEGKTWHTRSILLATGVVDTVPELPGIEQVQERGLLRQCPICDGYEHQGQRIVVLGDGAHAAREANFLAHYSTSVSHAGLTQVPTAAQGVRQLTALPKRVDVTAEGAMRLHLVDGQTHNFEVAYAALSVRPNSALGCALGARADADGNLLIDVDGATNVPGLFAAGDVVPGLDQLSIAAAQGAIAATTIHNLLREAKL